MNLRSILDGVIVELNRRSVSDPAAKRSTLLSSSVSPGKSAMATESRGKNSTQRQKGRDRRWNKSNAKAFASIITPKDSTRDIFRANTSPTRT